ncbi:MAG: iron-containing alcohol dehydrogenase [Rhodospirillaceae bacterium]|jgi:alcohol dehydrogenase class IV|nr:iron-containing alcohol dehydrogenase [Rhodospirillaceae bacterium]
MTDQAPPIADWNYPTHISFGVGRIAVLADTCKSLGMARPLLVTDQGIANTPMVKDAIAATMAAGLPTGLFAEVDSNPTGGNVDEGIAVFRKDGHDGIIAFGGGSALDAGKAIAFMAGQTLPLWDFEDVGDNWRRADTAGIAPLIAVPTTSGTGSETGRASVITDQAARIKKIIFHPNMMPNAVIADPALVVGLPPHLTAATGMDALAHCLEAYCAPGFHPMADGIAVEGLRLIRESLPTAVAKGDDLWARSNMMAAASMGSTAFQKGLGAIHALSHPVGALYGTHHGLTNAVFMPYVLVFNRPAIEDKAQRIARYMGLPKPSFPALLDWVLKLREDFSIPHTASDLGIAHSDLDRLSTMAADDPTAPGNPVPVGIPEMRKLYENALAGRL